jgi:1-acyl-sn-glycerol-3-phosphate acyltransferase
VSVPLITRTIVETGKICVPTVLESALGRPGNMEIYDRRLLGWAARLVKAAEIELTVDGRENLPAGESFVVMSNHQSHYDIIVLFHALQIRVRMVAKKELYKIPVFAGAMRIAGFVEIDRANRHQAVAALKGAKAAIDAGTSIWIAPEGTRSETGRMGSFKKGGFYMAMDSGARILPVSISGTVRVLKPHDWRIHTGLPVHVTISPPIDPKDYGRERRKDLMDVVHAAIAGPLPDEFKG